MRNLRSALLAVVCLGFTAPRVAWAEPAQVGAAIEPVECNDPDAPHVTRGTTARLGTAVGFVYGERVDAVAIGGTTAVGQRLGRLTIEAELAVLSLQARGGALRLGNAERLGAVARYDLVRIGIGTTSLIALFIEGGSAVAWNHWYRPGPTDPVRVIPSDTKRVEGQAGFGISLDHRLAQPTRFMRRFGWFLGWRFALAPHTSEPAVVCRSTTCRAEPRMSEDRVVDRSMLFQSSLFVTW